MPETIAAILQRVINLERQTNSLEAELQRCWDRVESVSLKQANIDGAVSAVKYVLGTSLLGLIATIISLIRHW
jgi:hypothetical protein